MQNSNKNIAVEITQFINKYCEMDINGVVIHCPYWINRLKDNKVTLRGFANGKGKSDEIRKELLRRLKKLPPGEFNALTSESIRKFARRERIGIDCSGLVYRVLDELLRLGFNTGYKNLDQIFAGGIDKTDVKRLTDPQYSKKIKNIGEFQSGDIIRLWGGKHAAIIINNNQKEISYVHSSALSTKIQGVHTSPIQITDIKNPLEEQIWEEKTRSGENFGEKRFNRTKGDGVFRLKVFR